MRDTTVTNLRADAARNRAAVIAAARAVFAERGLDAPLDEIARRAGVGNATLYRRFATREALIEAVFIERIAEYAKAAEEALEIADPWEGFCSYLQRILRLQAADRAFADLVVQKTDAPAGDLQRLAEQAYAGTVELVERAKTSGALRPDFQPQEVVLLLMANAGLIHRTADAAPNSSERVFAFVLDGLHASAATHAPPAPSEEQVSAAMSTAKGRGSRGAETATPKTAASGRVASGPRAHGRGN